MVKTAAFAEATLSWQPENGLAGHCHGGWHRRALPRRMAPQGTKDGGILFAHEKTNSIGKIGRAR